METFTTGAATYEIPWEWQEVICTCDNSVVALHRPADSTNDVCLNCNKYPRWWLAFNCKGCGENYVWWFKHHAKDRERKGWAHAKHLCWNCITEEDSATEDDIPPLFTKTPRELRSFDEIVADDAFELEDFTL
jgi:hypothetical protein